MIEPVPDYYRHNFISLLDAVRELYDDLLEEEELVYMDGFISLSEGAQCLYTRLISRVGPFFRCDKITYGEIPDIEGAACELEAAGFLLIDCEYAAKELLPLLLKDELARIAEEINITTGPASKLKRAELVEAIIASDEDESIIASVRALFSTYQPLGIEILAVIKLLFFGNFRQDLSEFILTVLGIVTYEDYPLEKRARAFSERGIIDDRVSLHNAAVDLYDRLSDLSREEIVAYAGDLAAAVEHPYRDSQISRRFERLMNELARQLERLGFQSDALELYRKAALPPSRERQARIHFASGEFEASLALCREMVSDPMCEEELDFGDFFIGRIEKKTGQQAPHRERFGVVYQDYQLPGPIIGPVESYALDLFTAEGYSGFYTENFLWNALFGLAFWDIIFLPLEGAFYNKFQRGPADLYTEQFAARRKKELEERMAELERDETWRERILDRFDKKEDVVCSLINWKRISREQVGSVLEHIPGGHLVAIFKRMARDLRANSNGFPDLVLFPPTRVPRGHSVTVFNQGDQDLSYLLVEVKGPSDQVQKNQKRWMKYFEKAGIPNRVFRMNLPREAAG